VAFYDGAYFHAGQKYFRYGEECVDERRATTQGQPGHLGNRKAPVDGESITEHAATPGRQLDEQ